MSNTEQPTPVISTKQHGAILWIILNRPKANAINAETSQKMNAAFDEFEQNPELRVAIITGAGEQFFSAGWDLNAAAEGEPADADYGQYGFGGLATRFHNTKPVIAAVNGYATGGGFEVALTCDLIIASDTASFALPESRFGVAPDTGSLRLPLRMPYHLAMEMLLTGKRIDAAEAARWGLVNQVVAPKDLLDVAEKMANKIIAGAPLAISAIKQLVNASQQSGLENNYQTLADQQFSHYQTMLNSTDAEEGPQAFSEKRDPQWKGR